MAAPQVTTFVQQQEAMAAQLLNELYTGINKMTQGLQSDDHGSSQPAASIRILLTVLNSPTRGHFVASSASSEARATEGISSAKH